MLIKPKDSRQWSLPSLALDPSQAPPCPGSTSSNSEATAGRVCVLRGQVCLAANSCCICPWAWAFGEPRPVIAIPADAACGLALLVSLCFFYRSQCHLTWNRIILNLVSSAKDTIPVLCTEPLEGGCLPNLHTPSFFVPQNPVDQTKADTQPTLPNQISLWNERQRETARQKSPCLL